MSISSNFWKELKKLEEEENKVFKNTTSRNTSGSITSDFFAELNRIDEDIAPTVGSLSSKKSLLDTMAEENRKKAQEDEEQKRTWFQKGALKDGFSSENIGKAILGTLGDIGENIASGIIGMPEQTLDALSHFGAAMNVANQAQNSLMYDFDIKKYKEEQKYLDEFAEKDLYNEQAIAKKIIAPITTDVGVDTDADSLLGERSDSLVQAASQMLATRGLSAVGVPWQAVTGLTSFGGELENALREGATHEEAGMSAAISAGAEVLSESLFGGSMIGEKGMINLDPITRGISSKLVKTIADWGVDATAEGFEEVVSEVASRLGSSLYKEENLKEILTSEEALDAYLESFVGGMALGGIGNIGKAVKSGVKGTDYRSDFNQMEQAVVDKLYEQEVSKKDKMTASEKTKLYESISEKMEKGYITAEDIESVLGGESYETFATEKDKFFGGETYKSYKENVEKTDDLQKKIEELGKKTDATLMEQVQFQEMRNEFAERRAKRTEQKKALDAEAQRIMGLREQMRSEVMEKVKDSRLAETYRELARSKQKFQTDVSKYENEHARKTVESILASGLGDNSNQFHDTVEWLASISEQKGVTFDLTKTERLKGTEHYREGYVTNGFKTKNGDLTNITVNLDGNYLNTTVGHEITHVLEEAGVYKELQSVVREFAIAKEGLEGYNNRMNAIKEIYGNNQTMIDSELTADIVGEYLFTDSDFVHSLSTQNRNVFQKVYDEIKYLWKVATAGSKEKRELERVKHIFDQAWRENVKGKPEQKTEEKEVKATIDPENDADLDYESPTKYSVSVKDPETIDFLENQEHITTYKAMVLVDGKLYPPMASKVKGEDGKYHMTNPRELGEWMQAEEDTTNIKFNDKGIGYYDLKKDDGGTVRAAYNPYEHSSNLVLNDQFEAAYKRGNLVTVECVIPKSEMDNPYKAEYAKDSTGVMDWHSGVVAGKLSDNKRSVYLSRYLKAVRIVPDSEVAQKYKEIVGDLPVPFNVVSPSLLTELENVGVNIDYNGSPQYQYLQRKAAEREAKKNTKYSMTKVDTDYLDAVNRGDMETAQRMVDEAAKKAGFIPGLYHGTQKYGFTKFDLSKMDDGQSIFLTDNLDVAESYSGTRLVRNPGAPSVDVGSMSLDEVIKEYNKLNAHSGEWNVASIDDKIDKLTSDLRKQGKIAADYLEKIDSIIPILKELKATDDHISAAKEWLRNIAAFENFTEDSLAAADAAYMDVVQAINYRNPVYSILSGSFDLSVLSNNARFARKAYNIRKSGDRAVEQKGHPYTFASETELRERLEEMLDVDNLSDVGNYALSAKIENPLRVNAGDSYWDQLRFIPKEAKPYLKAVKDAQKRCNETMGKGGYGEANEALMNATHRLGDFLDDLGLDYPESNTRQIAAYAKRMGYDGVIFEDIIDVGEHAYDTYTSNVYVVFNPANVKSTETVTYDNSGNVIPLSERFNAKNEDIRYSMTKDSAGNDLTAEQQDFFKDSKVVDDNGNLKVVYHGTASGEFTVFDKTKGSVEGDFGSGFYFTDNGRDAATNYEGGGPDFENKVARLAERIEAEEDIDYDEAKKRAREELFKGSHKFEVYLNIKNPAIVGKTILFDPDDYFGEYDQNDYDSEEDYESDVEQFVSDKISDVIWDVERNVDVYGNLDELSNVIWEAINEGGIGIEELKNKVNDLYLEDSDGNLVGNEVARQIIESLGYDGIIDHTVSTKWNMDMDSGTTHYIVFKPHQVKNVTNQEPTTNPDIRYSMSKNTKQQSYHDYLEAVNSGDTDTAQKLLDDFAKDAGYNYRGVHRSFANFTVFDREKIGSNAGTRLGDGFYVTLEFKDDATAKYADEAYGENRMDLYVKMESPLVLGTPFDESIVNKMEEDFSEFGWFGEDSTSYYAVTPEKIKKIFQSNDGYEQMETIRLIANRNGMKISELLKQYGFDGVVDENSYVKQAVVFDETQLKSAEPITYDEYGDVIMPYERFNKDNMDIRYSISKGDRNTSGDWHIDGREFGYHDEFEDFAPIREDVAKNAENTAKNVPFEEEDDKTPAQHRREKSKGYTDFWANLIGDTSTWVDLPLGLSYKTKTLRRILRKVVRDANGNPDIKKADAIYDALETKYDHNEALLKRESAKLKEVFQKLNLNHAEDEYAQMLGELRHNPETTLTPDVVKEYLDKHKGRINEDKVNEAIKESRKLYDDLLVRVNQVLREQGFQEIPYRHGYFPHFTNPKQGILGKIFNWKTIDNEIPTSIAGLTEMFKPNRSWQSFNKRRMGDKTDYSLYQGLDTYIHGALDWIYHIEDLQQRRSLENLIRYTHSEEGVKQRIEEIQNGNYDADEAQNLINAVLNEANNPLSGLVRELMNRTNTLANKKSSMDRAVEDLTSRKVYSVMTNLNNRITANQVVGSLSSALTNFIPMVQSWHQVSPVYTVKGMGDYIRSVIKDDGMVTKSDFLTNRLMEEEKLYQTGWDKVSDKAAFMMNVVDSITSNTVWRSKYLQNLREGMTEAQAIKDADQFAKNLMAGRSRGNAPTIFDAKNPLVKMFTAFQLEVANQYGYMFDDVVKDSKSKTRLVKGYATAFLGAYAYNALYSSLVGRDAAFDPISIIEELLRGLFDDEEEKEDVLMDFGSNILEEVPFVGGLMGGGRIPMSSAFPYSGYSNPVESMLTDISEGEFSKEWLKPLWYLAMPVGGGQIKKTIEGLGMFSDDHPITGSYTDSGNLRFPVEDTFGNRVQAALFGQYANKNARDYFDNNRSALKPAQIEEYMEFDAPIQDYWEYRDGLKGLDSVAEKADYINSLDLPISTKNMLINNQTDRKNPIDMTGYGQYDDFEEFDWATKNPEKYDFFNEMGISYKDYKNASEEKKKDYNWAYDYPQYVTLSKAVTDDVWEYREWYKDMVAFEADKNANGKSISGTKKKKVIEYINGLNIDYGAKLVLIKSQYKTEDDYNAEIFEYIKDKNDLTFEEKLSILKTLGFGVSDDGHVTWD